MFFTCDPDWSASERIGRERQREREGARKKFKDPDFYKESISNIDGGRCDGLGREWNSVLRQGGFS